MTKVRKKYRLLDSIETLRVYNLLRESQGIQIQPADGAESKLDAIVATASMVLFGENTMFIDGDQYST